jgi:hypothetical protein
MEFSFFFFRWRQDAVTELPSTSPCLHGLIPPEYNALQVRACPTFTVPFCLFMFSLTALTEYHAI